MNGKARKSINIKYDVDDIEILDGYYATSSHSNIIRYVLDGANGGKQKAHIAYGPYGSGKSYISTILVNILSKAFQKKELKKLSLKFNLVDTEISSRFIESNRMKCKFLPVLMNGYEGDFETAVLKALFRTLSQNKISIYSKAEITGITEIISNWKTNFPVTYSKFIEFLASIKLDENSFLLGVEDDSKMVDLFRKFYKDITSGATIRFEVESGLIDVLEAVLKELQAKNLGIFIVYDEFGRLLQNVKHHEVNRFMEQLQSLAELANSGSTNLSVLLIAHKPIRHYFMYLDRDARSEFSKIEKRFSVSEIKSDNNTFILITKEVIKKIRNLEIDEDKVVEQSRNLNKYRIFSSSLNDTEIENQIIRDCYPLHPVTLFSLPRISSIFGQNERTLFTFLHDESSFGLSGYVLNYSGYYYADNLVDYFFSTIDNIDLDNIKDVGVYRKSLSLLKSYFDNFQLEDAQRILKFCFLWSITNSNGFSNLSQNLISYSLGLNVDIVERILLILFERKILRVNATKKFIEIIEASAVDLEIEIAKRKTILDFNRKIVNETLNIFNPNRYLYPTEFNNKHDITRFSEIELNIAGLEFVNFENNNHDIFIRIIISNIDYFTENPSSDTYLVTAIKTDTSKIITIIKRIAALQSLSQDRHFLAEYRNVELEINHEISLALRKLDDFYKKIFTRELVFLSKSQTYKVKNPKQMTQLVEKQTKEYFSKTIVVHNDLINMYLISNIQEKSIIKVISLIIKYETNKLDGFFDGNKPEYLVYYSVFNSDYHLLKDEIRNYIRLHENGSLRDIFNFMKTSPYGVRPTLASLLFVFSVFDMWKNIMFFNKENFISEMPAKSLYNAGKGDLDFQYSYSNFEFENCGLIEKIVSNFGPMSEGVGNKSLTIKACSCLYNWYLRLPIIVQLGYNIGMQERYFTRSIELAKTNPKNSIEQIVGLINNDWDSIVDIKNNIENSFGIFIDNLDEKIRNSLNIDSWLNWAESQNDAVARSNEFVKICLESSCVIKDYAQNIEILEIERWPLAMFEVLKTNIEDTVARLNNELKTIEISINGEIRHIFDVSLSNKAQLMKTNLSNMIEANRKYVTKAEIEKVVLEIVEKFLN